MVCVHMLMMIVVSFIFTTLTFSGCGRARFCGGVRQDVQKLEPETGEGPEDEHRCQLQETSDHKMSDRVPEGLHGGHRPRETQGGGN